jgi:hypothetical protein
MFASPRAIRLLYKPGPGTASVFSADVNDALIVVILLNIWIGIPFNYLVIQSGLQGIPTNLHEAALIDGAGWWKELTRITIPLLRETLLTVLLLGIMGTLNVFGFVWILTQGGPADATMLPGLLAYTQAFVNFNYGQGAAVIVVVVVCSASPGCSCSPRGPSHGMSGPPRAAHTREDAGGQRMITMPSGRTGQHARAGAMVRRTRRLLGRVGCSHCSACCFHLLAGAVVAGQRSSSSTRRPTSSRRIRPWPACAGRGMSSAPTCGIPSSSRWGPSS